MLGLLILLSSAAAQAGNGGEMLSMFAQTCAVSTSYADLASALDRNGWKKYSQLPQSPLYKEAELVSPMLVKQGIAFDYELYSLNGSQHLEGVITLTKAPISGTRRLVGCSMYDLSANYAMNTSTLSGFAGSSIGEKSQIRDVVVEK